MTGSLSLEQCLTILAGISGVCIAWWLNYMSGRITDLQKDNANLRVHVAGNYVTKADINQHNELVLERLKEIRDHVTRVENKLDNKQDKGNAR